MFRLSKCIFIAPSFCNRLLQRQTRSLYSANVLGINGFEAARERTKMYMIKNNEQFRSKMDEFVQKSTNMIFTEDLKNMIHIAESASDIDLVVHMCRKFHAQSQETHFGNFVFGPVVMRMLHFMKSYNIAFKCFTDPELDGFFDQNISYQILINMLYEHGQYDKVFETFEVMKGRLSKMGKTLPRHVTMLIFATCYKVNTIDSLDYAKKLWQELKEFDTNPMRRSATFAAALAIKQNEPHIAIEILSTVRQSNYMTVKNLKIIALSRLSRCDDALTILRTELESRIESQKMQTLTYDTIDELAIAIKNKNDKELQSKFNKIEKTLIDNDFISRSSLDELLCVEVTTTSQTAGRDERNRLSASYNNVRRSRSRSQSSPIVYNDVRWKQIPVRPSLKDMY